MRGIERALMAGMLILLLGSILPPMIAAYSDWPPWLGCIPSVVLWIVWALPFLWRVRQRG